MAEKQSPCCARVNSKLLTKRGELATLARREAYYNSKGRDTMRYAAQIAKVRAEVKAAEQMIVDHEAEHAGEGQ